MKAGIRGAAGLNSEGIEGFLPEPQLALSKHSLLRAATSAAITLHALVPKSPYVYLTRVPVCVYIYFQLLCLACPLPSLVRDMVII